MASEVTRFEFNRQEFVRYSDYAELEAKLAALDWTPITADNLPKGPSGDYAGDEVLEVKIRDTDNFSITIVLGDWDSGWLQERPVYYQYRRPINPPQEPK